MAEDKTTPKSETDSRLSAGSLFHFTSSLENLLGILTHEFKPRLSVESFELVNRHFLGKDGPEQSGIPMVCFCDLRLSQVERHMGTYGPYGIGLTKAWGRRHGISPVMYVHETSIGPRSVASIMRMILEGRREEIIRTGSPANVAGRLVYFLKPYEGKLRRYGRPPEQVRFYDEREWRYIPEDVESISAISPEDLADARKAAPVLAQVDQLSPIPFTPDDITHLIVAKNDEVLKLIDEVRTIKTKYGPARSDILASRIVSAERIRADV